MANVNNLDDNKNELVFYFALKQENQSTFLSLVNSFTKTSNSSRTNFRY